MSYFGVPQSRQDEAGETVRVRLCDRAEIPTGRYRCFKEGALSFLVCNVKGTLYAIINQCSHMKVPLDGGRQFGKDFICPVHGARFDIPSGKALSGAAVGRLATYPVTIEDEGVFVELPVVGLAPPR